VNPLRLFLRYFIIFSVLSTREDSNLGSSWTGIHVSFETLLSGWNI